MAWWQPSAPAPATPRPFHKRLEQIAHSVNADREYALERRGRPMPETTDAQQRSLELVKEFYAAKERHDLDASVSTNTPTR
jgi:hypothetical protein